MAPIHRRPADFLLRLRWLLPAAVFAAVVVQQIAQIAFLDPLGPAFRLVSNLAIYALIGPIALWWGLTQLARIMAERDEIELASRRDLELRVAQRTKELEQATRDLSLRNAELEKANRELRELDRLKSDFVSMVSHELRAPLTNLNGAVELMRSECPGQGESCRHMIGVISDQAVRLTQFVQGILNVSRLEAGQLALHMEPVDLWKAVEEIVCDIELRTGPRFTLRGPRPLPAVQSDPERVREILLNLMDNAVKYSPKGGEIIVELEPRDMTVEVAVVDQGIGISAADQQRIFERFYRVDGTDDREVYGHGLGLYIVKTLVEALGGHINVFSEPGNGSRFTFDLPRVL